MAATPGPARKGEQRRLVIKEMVLENFKSYAGAVKVGPFHKCFSSVVGPNGSGKSNVIDGLLFVFGRRAKQLRFNKVSELIHNSANHRNLQQAKVSVHFVDIIDKEGEEFEIVPGSDLIVSRTATRQNASDYYINDRRVPVKEVTTLLKAKGIDLDNNRFLILQGEVEQISMMKPKGEDKGDTGLLEYLEDIIGTHIHIPLIEDAHKRLEELNDERQRAVTGVKTVERVVEQLEGPRKAAEVYLAKKIEAEQLTARNHLLHMHVNQVSIQDREAKGEELQGKLAHEEGKVANLDGALKEAEQGAKAAEKDLAKGTKALEKLRAAFSKHECRDSEAQENKKHLRAQADKLRTKIAADTKKLQKLEKECGEMEEGIPAKQEEAQRLTEDVEAAQQVLDGMLAGIKDEVEAYRSDLSKVREQLAPWEEQITGVQSRIDVATAERDVLQRQQREAQAAHQAAVEGAATARQAAADKREEISGMQTRLQQLRQDMEAHRGRLAVAQQEEEQHQATVQRLRGAVEQLRQEASSQQTKGRAQQALLEAKADGTIPGLYGRLGDLGAVDAKYDVAVSTAAGALDFILVETEEDARKGVELLRQRGLGRLTFLIRQKQEHLQAEASRKVQTPKDAPRLFDLVKYRDDKFKVAFYYAFRNTLVAPDLPVASSIAYARDSQFRRVVTLQGQLIESSGTMTGGGSQPRRGAMCIGKAAPKPVDAAASAAELKMTERQLQMATQELQAAQQVVAEASAALKEAERGVQQLEVGLPKASAEAEAQEARAADLQQRLQQLQQAAEAAGQDTEQQQQLEATIKKEQAALQKLERSAAGLRAEAKRLEEAMENAGGPALKKQKDAVEKLHKGIAEATAAGTKLGVQLKAAQKQADKLRKDLAKQEAEQERLVAEREQLEKDMVEWEAEALEVLKEVQAQEAAVGELQAAVDEARQERDKQAGALKLMQGVAAKIKAQLAEVETFVAQKQRDNKAHQKELDEIAQKLAELRGDMPMLTEEETQQEEGAIVVTAQQCLVKVGAINTELDSMNADLGAIEEYRQKEAEYQEKLAAFRDVTAKRDETRKEYDAVRKKRLEEFMAGFNVISLRLKEVYQMITLGGDAELELVDSLDPFSEGIVFSVRPPKKSWKNISNLSGGEKTLSSLALVFALHYYKPTPLYVMDEIDAALDFKNVSIVGHFIKERTKDAQFVIISLRNNMFELADVLVGIYKTFNATKTVTINPSDYVVGTPAPSPGLSTPGSTLRSPLPVS